MSLTYRPVFIALVISAILIGVTGCIDTTEGPPQAYLSITITNQNTIAVVRDLIEKFAEQNGFPHHTTSGPPILAQTQQFVDGFYSQVSDDYITSSNIKDSRCIGIAIFMGSGPTRASQIRNALIQYVKGNFKDQIKLTPADVCQSKELEHLKSKS